jgi:hypothetical protein
LEACIDLEEVRVCWGAWTHLVEVDVHALKLEIRGAIVAKETMRRIPP